MNSQRAHFLLQRSQVCCLICLEQTQNSSKSLTFGNSLTTLCPFSLGFVHFQLASCGVYVVRAARRQSERFSMHRTQVLWGRLMEWVETAVKGKIEGGREKVRQETPNHSLSSASIHSPLHLGVQKSACGLIPLSFHRQIINF